MTENTDSARMEEARRQWQALPEAARLAYRTEHQRIDAAETEYEQALLAFRREAAREMSFDAAEYEQAGLRLKRATETLEEFGIEPWMNDGPRPGQERS